MRRHWALLVPLSLGATDASAKDPFAWTPAGDPTVERGREVSGRFGLANLWDVQVTVDDAFSPENRKAAAAAAAAARKVPGVKRVVGPAGLLDLRADGPGEVKVAPALEDPADDARGLLVRERLKRRNDALGWFLPQNGKSVHFLVEAGNATTVRGAVAEAIKKSGFETTGTVTTAAAQLWPAGTGGLRWQRLLLAALAAVAGVALGTRLGRPGALGAVVIGLAAALGAGALLVTTDLGPMRAGGVKAAVVAGALSLAAAFLLARGRTYALPRRLLATGAALGAVLVVAGIVLEDRLVVRSNRWSGSRWLFVSAKGDMEDPLVLREVRRLTDFLRAQGGVVNAWSVADVFPAFAGVGDEVERIPDEAREVRRVLGQAAADAALTLELSADHREALVPIRLRPGREYGREVLGKLATYLKAEFRSSMLRIEVGDKTLPAETRTVGKGVLASDTKERVVRISARHGRALGEDDTLGVDRVAKQAAFVQTGEPKLKDEIADEVRAFVAGPGAPEVKGGDVVKLVDDLKEQPGDHTVEQVKASLATYYPAAPEEKLVEAARELHARLAEVRRKHAARINAKEMLFSASLPPTGRLADEVKAATLDAMAPAVGVPIGSETPGAIVIDAAPIGAAVQDRALEASLEEGLRTGGIWAIVGLGILLAIAAGPRGLLFLPIGLAPVAALLVASALGRRPVGVSQAVMASVAFAFGAALSAAMAAGGRSSAARPGRPPDAALPPAASPPTPPTS